jgi:hypothetical protein
MGTPGWGTPAIRLFAMGLLWGEIPPTLAELGWGTPGWGTPAPAAVRWGRFPCLRIPTWGTHSPSAVRNWSGQASASGAG